MNKLIPSFGEAIMKKYVSIFFIFFSSFLYSECFSQTCTLGSSFGENGKVFTNFSNGNNSNGSDVIQLSDGNLLMAGTNGIAKISNVDGSFINSFGNSGKISIGSVEKIKEQPDGKIVGITGNSAIFRINSNGTLDMSFGTNGFASGLISVRDIAVQTDGKIIVVGAASSNGFAVARYNADGSVDNSFNGDGIVVTPIGASGDAAYSVAIQSDGKIVVGGSSTTSTAYSFSIIRYNSNGSLDNTFDGDGKASAPFSNFVQGSSDIAIQTDGKIIQAGTIRLSGSQTVFALARYNSNGTLDNTFDGDGELTTAIGSSDEAQSIFIQSDGKPIVVGITAASAVSDANFALVRYNTNGSLDNSFDSDGKLASPIGILHDYAYAVIVQSDGKIFAGGYAYNGSTGDFAIAKYNTNGSFDNTFNGNGKLLFDVGGSEDVVNASDLQADCKIVVAGYSNNGSNYDFAVARYNADGSLDNSFDGDGKLTTAILSGNDYATAVATQTDGKIVVAGYSNNGSNYDFAVVRYNTDGSLDNTFDGDGKLTTAIGSSDDVAYSISLQTDGKIVVAGTSNGAFALVRYNSNGTLDNTFNGTGKVTTTIGTYDVVQSLVIQSDGKIVAAGYSNNSSGNFDFALARYNSDGTPDNSFDGDGKLTTTFGTYNEQAYSVALQADGKIIAAGDGYNSSFIDGFAIARYNTDGSLDVSFDGDGKVTTSINSQSTAKSIHVQADGKIVVAGSSAGNIVLARYNNDGSLDNSFGNTGLQTFDLGGQDYASSLLLTTNGYYIAGYSNRNDVNDFILMAINANGNILLPGVPTITSFTPDNGYSGTSITITGTNFTGATSVTIGGTNVASFTVNDDSHITAIVGAGITGAVSVTTAGGTGSSSSNFTYNGYVTAAANGDWNSGATWLGGNIPPASANKTLNHAVNIHSPVTNTGAITANTYFNIYSTFTNNGTTTIPGSLQMGDGGVFVNNGVLSYGTTGTLGYYNSIARTTGDEFPAANGPNILSVSNLAGVTLHASRSVSYLNIQAGSFTLGDNNITVSAILSSTPAHYIVTNGLGTLTIKNISSSPVLFPVGPSATSYNPITISNGGGDDFSVKVQPTFTNALNDASKAVNAQWTISKTGAQTGNNVTLTPQWNASNEAGYPTPTFNRNSSIVLGHYGGSSWNEILASAISGVGPYTTTISGVSSFSSFGVGNANAFALSIPTITSFTPDNGYSGTSVTITGTNFTGATTVTIGGTNVALFTVNDDSHITAIVGAGITGTVSVTTAGGTASSTTAFTYNGYVTANDGDWSDGSTWLGGNVPTTGATVTVINSVVVPTPLTNTGTVYINNGGGQLILSSVYTNSGSTTCNNGSIKLNEGGSVAGSAIIYNGTSNSITYAGTTPQTTSSLEFPSTNGPNSLGISNPTSVTLHAPRSISNLFLGLGILTTNNNLTLNNSAGILRLSGSLADFPIFGSSVYITYLNSSDIITGNEIPVPNTPLQQLAVSASGNVTLNDNVVVDGAVVTNSSGNLILGNKNITTNAVFKSAAGYIITNSTGTLTVKNITSSPILFPVGSSATSYNPVTISNGAGDNFSVSVQSTFTNPPLDASKVVNAQWTISKTGAQTGNNVTLTPQWNPSNEAGYPTPTFNRNSSIVLGHYGGSSWNEIPASAVSGSGTYTTTVTGVSSFSSFGVGNANAFALSLPTITSFTPDNGYSGTSVTITGTNFTNATAITIGGTNVASFTVNDDSHIAAIVGGGTTGVISVTGPGGTGSSATSFTYSGYVTANNGNWSDGVTWLGGNVPADGASVTINHIVTMDISPTVSNGNSMIVNGTLNCGYNMVSGTGSAIINGIVKTPNGAGFSGATNTSFTNTLSSLTLGPSSTVEYNGVFNTVISENDYANLTSSSVGGRLLSQGRIGISGVFTPGSNTWGTLYASSTVEFNGTDPQDIPAIPYDNLTLSNTGIKTLSNTADSIVVGGNITIGLGSTLNASVSLHIKGNWINDGFLSNNNNFIQFNGVTSQTITGTYPTTFRDIFVSNESGIYLNKDIRISSGSQLVFGTDGTKIHTGTNRVVLEDGANISFDNNPTTYIHGSLQMSIPWGSSTKYFKIGDATTYCPVTIDFFDVNGIQNFVVSPSESGADHPNIGTSALNARKSVNRYWKFTNDSSPFFAGTYDVTFEFSTADIDAGANPANFKIGMYSEGAWTYPTTVYIDATHIKAIGISGFGDFAIAEIACTEPLIINQPLSTQTICQNTTATELMSSATGDGLNYQWYYNTLNSNSGGTSLNPMGTNSTYTPSASAAGTLYYYCVVTNTCGTATSNVAEIIVNATQTYYQDADGDGFGNPNISIQSCTQPQGYVIDKTDCDDTKLLYADNDGDGYGAGTPVACGVGNNTDCDDNDPNVYPYFPSVNITSDVNPLMICQGLLVTFTATPFYGGNAPSYQWKKNNINVGTNSDTYNDASLADADVITCELTSNAACATNTTVLSNSIFMSVHPLPVVNADTYPAYTTNDPPFVLSGTPIGGSFSGIGVTGAGNMFDPSIAGPGNHTITYFYADGNGCSNSATTIIHVTNYTGCTLPPALGNISGSTTACGIAGTATSSSYSIDNIPGATYVWTKSSSLIQIVSGQNTNSINATFSNSFSSGTITVTVINACGSTARVISISKKTPATPGTISGITNPCAYVGTPITYSIKQVAGATSYTWTVPAGVSITGSTSPYTTADTSIDIIYSTSFTTGSINVTAGNACGTSAARTLAITNKVPATPGTISGPTDVCYYIGANANVTYTINKVANATSYEWIIPDGVNIISANVSDTSIVLNFPDTYTTGTIKVNAKSGCGDGAYRSFTVTKKLPGTPGVISGPSDVCDYIGANADVTYSINKVANATSYQWQIPAGVNIISTNINDTSIVLNFPGTYTTGTIQVKAQSGCGDGAYRSFTVAKKLPGIPGVITATGDICSSMYAGLNTVTYTIPANTISPLPTSYVWTLIPTISQSAEIVSGSGVINSAGLTVETTGTSIQIQFYGSYTGGTLSVVAKKSCGTSAARKLTLTKNVPPTPALSVLTGTICSGTISSVFYTASAQPNTDYYIWSSPTGTKIEGSETKSPTRDTTTYNTIVIDYPANFTSGNLTVKGKSVCGISAVATIAVSSQPCSILSKNIQGDAEIYQEQTTAVIYPNPNDGDFMLKIKSANRTDNAQIEITDITGRPVGEYTISNNNGNMLLHVNNKTFTAGAYILKYKIGNEVKFLKFIIER